MTSRHSASRQFIGIGLFENLNELCCLDVICAYSIRATLMEELVAKMVEDNIKKGWEEVA